MAHLRAIVRRSPGGNIGLPIGDGNEWNTGGSGNPYTSPFGPPGSHLPITPGSHHPSNFEPFEIYYGPGYQPVYEPPATGGGGPGPAIQPPPPAPPQPVPTTGGIKPIRGVITVGGAAIPVPPVTAPANADGADLLTQALSWVEQNPVVGSAIAATIAGLFIYTFTGTGKD